MSRAQYEVLRQYRRDNRLCVQCGSQDLEPGYKNCRRCLERANLVDRKRYYKPKGRGEASRQRVLTKEQRKALGLCIYCGGEKEDPRKVGCQICRKKRWELAKKGNNRKWELKKKFGLTLDDYDSMLLAQNGVCAICGEKDTGNPQTSYLGVDHDHKTGKVRGLLCSRCNHTLGHAKDSIVILENAIQYLRKYNHGDK